MTVQYPETILYRGRRYFSEESPLHACTDPATVGRINEMRHQRYVSSLSRGYRGTWAVRDGRL